MAPALIAAGDRHSCAVAAGGTVKCWGYNVQGQLGNGSTSQGNTPGAVSALTGAVTINAGDDHTCATRTDGTARCWGQNRNGQLGNASNVSSSVPVTVTGLANVAAIDAGDFITCASLTDGGARCWGYNFFGQVGNGTNGASADAFTPATVTGLTGVAAIAADGSHSCAVRTDGTARCWGSNFDGELGNGSTTNSSVPVTVTGFP